MAQKTVVDIQNKEPDPLPSVASFNALVKEVMNEAKESTPILKIINKRHYYIGEGEPKESTKGMLERKWGEAVHDVSLLKRVCLLSKLVRSNFNL